MAEWSRTVLGQEHSDALVPPTTALFVVSTSSGTVAVEQPSTSPQRAQTRKAGKADITSRNVFIVSSPVGGVSLLPAEGRLDQDLGGGRAEEPRPDTPKSAAVGRRADGNISEISPMITGGRAADSPTEIADHRMQIGFPLVAFATP
jgi:hypothetical protein